MVVATQQLRRGEQTRRITLRNRHTNMALLYTQEAQLKHFLYFLCRRSRESIVVWCFGEVESAVHSLIETHKHG